MWGNAIVEQNSAFHWSMLTGYSWESVCVPKNNSVLFSALEMEHFGSLSVYYK